MSTQHYTVSGMTCGHCVNHVTEEVQAIPGVDEVKVVLEGGAMEIQAKDPVSFDEVRAAVAEAGDYTVVEA